MVTDIWKKTQDHLRALVPSEQFDLYVAPMKLKSLDSGLLTFEVLNKFHAEWLERNIKRELLRLLNPEQTGVYELGFSYPESPHPTTNNGLALLRQESTNAPILTGFSANYTFDRFVVGPTNRFAHASSVAVSQNPGKQFNPLFIYGHAGLGKTHLLHAIGHAILKQFPKMSVLYINAESFVNEYINALKNHSIDGQRERFRGVDCLLIDDIQFLVGKEHSEQEFFHTFNALYDSNRQVVLTSDRPPKDLQPLESRLVSRLEWGVTCDIKPPDFETRLAILRKKCELEQINAPDEVLQHLAQNIRSNVRVLEGSLKSIVAFCCLAGGPMTLDAANQILKQLQDESPRITGNTPSIAKIQEVVAKHYHTEISDLKDRSRTASKVLPRQVAIYLSREITRRSLDEIGRAFGGRDHSTVLHSVTQIGKLIRTDPYISQFINKLKEEILITVGD
ncbi:MAG: chromosomal replication initiator protein DnaA [Elusimicrobia bacterium]|nr:chromosomal replication initiator protein DnaA [Elusimicrobiota bacterium]